MTICEWFDTFNPGIRNEPDFSKVARVLLHARTAHSTIAEMTDALAELIPEQREFWLRVGATAEDQFVRGMTRFFEEPGEQETGETP